MLGKTKRRPCYPGLASLLLSLAHYLRWLTGLNIRSRGKHAHTEEHLSASAKQCDESRGYKQLDSVGDKLIEFALSEFDIGGFLDGQCSCPVLTASRNNRAKGCLSKQGRHNGTVGIYWSKSRACSISVGLQHMCN